jgi:hypothetical protein
MADPQRTVLLIGPTMAGKSTVGRLLAERLSLPQVSLDTVRHQYRTSFPLDPALEQHLRHTDYERLLTYWEPFAAYTVERALTEHPHGVFDFGAIHSVYDDPQLQERVAALLIPYPFVLLLLPTPHPEESVSVLMNRGHDPQLDAQTIAMWERIIRRFVLHPGSYSLAKQTFYTHGTMPEAIADDIATFVVARPSADDSPPHPTETPPTCHTPADAVRQSPAVSRPDSGSHQRPHRRTPGREMPDAGHREQSYWSVNRVVNR